MIIILINGVGGSGKDSFVLSVQDVAMKSGLLVNCISTIDPVKDIYKNLGWDGRKTPEHRANLNLLKNIWIKNTNNLGPLSWTREQIRLHSLYKSDILFIMIREYEQILCTMKMSTNSGFKTHTLFVQQEGCFVSEIEQKLIDEFPDNFKWDFLIYNPLECEVERHKNFYNQAKHLLNDLNLTQGEII
jgi:hypothetical protein